MINLRVEVDGIGISNTKNMLVDLKKDISSNEINMHRARSFKKYSREMVRSGQSRLVPLSSATIFLTGAHNPEFLTGKLMDAMKVEASEGNSAIAGYWNPSEKVPGKSITYADLAVIQHTGYRIPLTGEKGRRVRAWLAMQGLGDKNSGRNKNTVKNIVSAGQWIIVPPRPFMTRTMESYLETDGDMKAINEYLGKIDR